MVVDGDRPTHTVIVGFTSLTRQLPRDLIGLLFSANFLESVTVMIARTSLIVVHGLWV